MSALIDTKIETIKKPPGFSLGNLVKGKIIEEVLDFIKTEDYYSWSDPNGNITRKTYNFGWNYAAMECGVYTFRSIPSVLKEARRQIILAFGNQLPKFIIPEFFDNMILTVYNSGQYLIPHYDADQMDNPITKRNFSFAEPIIGWVIQPDVESSLTFHHHPFEGRPGFDEPIYYKTPEVTGATFIMDKESRHFPYFHSIPPVQNTRISLTMRRTILPKSA